MLSFSCYQLWAWPWHAEGWRYTESKLWSKIQGKKQPDLSLQKHSLEPAALHFEIGSKPPSNLSGAEHGSEYFIYHLLFHLSCNPSQFKDEVQGKEVKKYLSLLYV